MGWVVAASSLGTLGGRQDCGEQQSEETLQPSGSITGVLKHFSTLLLTTILSTSLSTTLGCRRYLIKTFQVYYFYMLYIVRLAIFIFAGCDQQNYNA